MTFQIIVEQDNGQFAARLLGNDGICVVRPTRDEAVDAMTREIEQRVERGEIVSIEVPRKGGAAAVVGMFQDDPDLREIVDEIYAERDRERDELPE